ncbi:DedA family protein [bacterium]|nr:DedA family protein [bacterium]
MFRPLRRLYDWTLHWAETPYGPLALFIMSFAESSFFPVPPDVLLIALCLGAVTRSFRFAMLCSIASVLGGLLGYAIGHFVWYDGSGQYSVVASFFFKHIPGFTEELFKRVQTNYDRYGFWYVFAAGFTPIPYKVFTIASGVFEMNLAGFTVASAISRSMRFFLVAGLIRVFGEHIKSFIDRYFNLLTVVFTVLLAGSFLLVKFMPGRERHGADSAPGGTNMAVSITNILEVTR